eukprot:GHUV01019123.1.p1 GENE.GHUV01019123.1~~GHUV01019123.1.p1  ORF type:complete len:191 (+),score=37.23 GHUV01019123.1:777-1349(+)
MPLLLQALGPELNPQPHNVTLHSHELLAIAADVSQTQSPSAKLSQDHQQVLKSSALATPPQGAEEAKATAAAARAGATAADLEQGAPAPSPSTSSTPDADVITKDLARDGVRVVVAEPPVAETTMDRPAACNTSSNGLTVDWCDCCTNNGHVTSLKIPKEVRHWRGHLETTCQVGTCYYIAHVRWWLATW